MTLYTQTMGQGDNLVLLHGWGFNSTVWADIAQQLAENWRVTLVDLPGHGLSQDMPVDYTLDNLADIIAAVIPGNSTVIGWSLGGMIALQLALRYSGLVTRLVLIASTPRFVTGTNWPYAVSPEVIKSFAGSLAKNYQKTIQQFLALQVKGEHTATTTLRKLQHLISTNPPDPKALAGGLEILSQTTLLPELETLKQPTLWIYGRQDMLIPVASSSLVLNKIPDAQIKILEGAAHTPFLSHPSEVIESLYRFLSSQ